MVVILINKLMVCNDMFDVVYCIEVEKFVVIIEDIKECVEKG